MPELPDAVSAAVSAHEPGSTPPFASLVRRRVRRRRVRVVGAVAAVLAVPAVLVPLANGGGDDETEQLAGQPQRFRLSVSYERELYEQASAQEALLACAERSEAVVTGSDQSLPPIDYLELEGTEVDVEGLRACLRQTPGAEVAVVPATAAVDGPGVEPTQLYRFSVSYDPGTYDDAEASTRFGSCTNRPGTSIDPLNPSAPPIRSGTLTGTRAAADDLVACLQGSLGATISVDEVPAEAPATKALVTYPDAALPYEAAALRACTDPPAQTQASLSRGLPTLATVLVSGDERDRLAVLACLNGISGARVVVPGPSTTSGSTADPGPVLGAATWRLAGTPSPMDTRIPILVTERACSGGQSAEGRVERPGISYGSAQVRVNITVRQVDGEGPPTCPGNPETPYELVLREPLGGRELVDASR